MQSGAVKELQKCSRINHSTASLQDLLYVCVYVSQCIIIVHMQMVVKAAFCYVL